VESDRRRETTAASHDGVVAKASDLVARLSQGRPTDLAQAHGDVPRGTGLICAYAGRPDWALLATITPC
jgi:hypothetical protein